MPRDRRSLGDFRVRERFDGFELFIRDGILVAKIETQPIGVDLATLLLRMLAQFRLQSVVQDVGCGVGASDGVTTRFIDDGLYGFSFFQ